MCICPGPVTTLAEDVAKGETERLMPDRRPGDATSEKSEGIR